MNKRCRCSQGAFQVLSLQGQSYRLPQKSFHFWIFFTFSAFQLCFPLSEFWPAKKFFYTYFVRHSTIHQFMQRWFCIGGEQKFSNIGFSSEKGVLSKPKLVSANFTRSFLKSRMKFLLRGNEKYTSRPRAQRQRLTVTRQLCHDAANQENPEQVLLTQNEGDCLELNSIKVSVISEDWPDS